MTKIQFTEFMGEATGVTPRLIPAGYAQEARNVDVRKRTLRGIRDRVSSGIDVGLSNPQTIYRYRDSLWLAFADDVDVVKSPIIGDAFSRIYWTGEDAPRMAAVDTATQGQPPYPNTSFKLGIPSPVSAPSASSEPPPAELEPEPVILNTVYVVTLVSVYGEEGPPSDPSNIVQRYDGGDVELTLPPGTATGRDIQFIRVYRSEEGGTFSYVADVPAAQNTFTDSVNSADLLGVLPSESWLPPNENMKGLMAGPSNSLCGFFDNVIAFSESNLPHAWPLEYRLKVDDDVVGMARSQAGIVVATRGRPFLLVGTTPESMVPVEIETDQAGASKRSVVGMGDYVLYASPEGLTAVGQGASLVTDKLLEREEWREINPYSIHAYREGDRYLAFYTNKSGAKGSFAFSPERGFEFFDGTATAAYYDKYEDVLYLADGQVLDKFDAGDRVAYRWRSGILETKPGTTFSMAKVIADAYPVTLRLIAPPFGEQFTVQAVNQGLFRLPPAPGGPALREWQVEIETDKEVFSVQIAQSASEII